jgi:uncharacterized membrane protein SpoIIM required for sporulation
MCQNRGMDFNYFLRERRPRWQRLAELLDRVDSKGLHGLNPREADELFSLYRLTSSDLNLVQTRTANPSLVDYLEGLVARAYADLVVPRKAHFFRAWWMILRNYFPAAVRSQWRAVSLSALTLVAGVIFGFAATWANPRAAAIFLPPEHLQETPRQRVAALEQLERDGNSRISTVSEHSLLTIYLFNNNIRVGALGFALGFTFGIGTVIVLFYNGAMLGSLAALYFMDGVGKFFVAWVGPHGSIELPCTVLGCAAGFMLAARQLRRGDTTMMAQIREIRPKLVDILVGSSSLLVIAGIIEGGFSQINEPTISYWFKIAVAVVLFISLLAYLFIMPAKPRPAAEAIENQVAVAQGPSGAAAREFAAP